MVLGRNGTSLGPGALEDSRLSRSHVEIVAAKGTVRLRDLGSRNGTSVNAVPVTETELVPGDIIAAGSLLFLLHTAPEVYEQPRHNTLVGRSHALGHVVDQLKQVASRPTTVLLLGETGTGKEVVARALHDESHRPGRFVAVNCGSVADTLLQSELFGHVRGAFTGAQTNRSGLVEEAAGGTLFLDEIGDASPSLQAGLLRLLQEKVYRPVGATRTLTTDARVVAATHRNLAGAVATGAFREDLWMRLSRWVIEVPSLHDRTEDIPLLAHTFAQRYAGRPVTLDRSLVYRLMYRAWPGNVRELDGCVERIVVSSPPDADRLTAPDWLLADSADPPSRVPSGSGGMNGHSAPGGRRKRPSADELRRVLLACDGEVKAAASQLGVTRKTAYRWMEKAGVDIDAVRQELDGA